LAANKGKLEAFHYLADIGADLNIHDVERNTALHRGAILGDVEIIKVLLDKGMSVDLTNAKDATPHLSAPNCSMEATKPLV
jgi:ankyrin repeat protein